MKKFLMASLLLAGLAGCKKEGNKNRFEGTIWSGRYSEGGSPGRPFVLEFIDAKSVVMYSNLGEYTGSYEYSEQDEEILIDLPQHLPAFTADLGKDSTLNNFWLLAPNNIQVISCKQNTSTEQKLAGTEWKGYMSDLTLGMGVAMKFSDENGCMTKIDNSVYTPVENFKRKRGLISFTFSYFGVPTPYVGLIEDRAIHGWHPTGVLDVVKQ